MCFNPSAVIAVLNLMSPCGALQRKTVCCCIYDKRAVEANHHLGFAADAREYHMAAQMLLQMGIRQVRLLTNNPAKISALEEYGIEVVARERLEICANSANVRYLATKRDKLGHLIASLGAE
jgi:3,4-dihydroxy 2-butanone 4-phosphate synthase/GTP cyclohydrolase II